MISNFIISPNGCRRISGLFKITDNLSTWKDAYFYTYEERVRGSFVEPSKSLIVISFRVHERSVGCFSDTYSLIVHRKKPCLSDDSLRRCRIICGL